MDNLNGGNLWHYNAPEQYAIRETPQLIGAHGIQGGAKAISGTIAPVTSKVDEFTNLLKPINELDPSVTLYRGLQAQKLRHQPFFYR